MDETIGHYRIVSELGRGGMGVVYKAHEESLNRFVALKVLGEHLVEDTSYVERFMREARSAAKLNHPNIIQVYTVGEDKGRHYFVMEYVTGRSLQSILREKGRMGCAEAARLILQAAAGLHAAHQVGVIHRDVKPANLMIDERGIVKIADFGLALMAGGATRLTATGMFMGTPGYLSPEQCSDASPDLRTDIYSLGVTFYEMVTGQIPFNADSPLALLRQILEVEPPDVRTINPEVDEDTRTILKRMMAKKREERYPSCEGLIKDLQSYLEGRGVSREEVASVTSGVAAAFTPSPAPPAPTPDTPTVHMDSGGAQPPAPPPAAPQPPPPPVAATETAAAPPPPPPAPVQPTATAPPQAVTPPPIQQVTHEPERGGRSAAVVIAAVLLIGLAVIVGATAVAWKTGLLERTLNAMKGSESGQEATASEEQLVASLATGEDDSQSGAVEGSSAVEVESPDSARVEQAEAAPTGARESAPGTGAGARQELIEESRPRGAEPPTKQRQADRSQQRQAPPPPPPAEGVVVVAIGEPLLAGEGEALVEKTFRAHGLKLVDERGLPSVVGLLGDDSGRTIPELLRVLRPHARQLVVVNAQYLGSRELKYMGRYDTAHQARLTVTPFDLASGEAIAPSFDERVEYTHLSVSRVLEETLGPGARLVAAGLR